MAAAISGSVSRVSDVWNAVRTNGTAHNSIPAGLAVSLSLFWTFNKKQNEADNQKQRKIHNIRATLPLSPTMYRPVRTRWYFVSLRRDICRITRFRGQVQYRSVTTSCHSPPDKITRRPTRISRAPTWLFLDPGAPAVLSAYTATISAIHDAVLPLLASAARVYWRPQVFPTPLFFPPPPARLPPRPPCGGGRR